MPLQKDIDLYMYMDTQLLIIPFSSRCSFVYTYWNFLPHCLIIMCICLSEYIGKFLSDALCDIQLSAELMTRLDAQIPKGEGVAALYHQVPQLHLEKKHQFLCAKLSCSFSLVWVLIWTSTMVIYKIMQCWEKCIHDY